jgi:hypothetical protein
MSRSRMARKSRSLSRSKGKKKVKRGGCGAQGGLMYGGDYVASDATRLFQGSELAGGSPLSPASYGTEPAVPVPVPVTTKGADTATTTGMMGGRYRSRRFRKSRSMKSMKVFPNNIFRNMF